MARLDRRGLLFVAASAAATPACSLLTSTADLIGGPAFAGRDAAPGDDGAGDEAGRAADGSVPVDAPFAIGDATSDTPSTAKDGGDPDGTGDAASPCSGVGQACPDGTIYAGLSPDGNRRMFVSTLATASGLPWGSSGVSRGTTSTATGWANTLTLIGAGASAHPAAEHCHNLTANGHSDWYLPAWDELTRIFLNRASLGNIGTDWVWSSTEQSSTTAFERDFVNGSTSGATKTDPDQVICVRRD